MGKDNQRDSNPALTIDRKVGIPTGGNRDANGSSSQTGKASANKGIEIPRAVNVDPKGIRGSRVLPHGA